MGQTLTNPMVDDYIANAEAFAQPILLHLRKLLHKTCPAVVEEIKWGIPHFDYHGEMMCMLAAYTKHCSFSFWKESIMSDPRLRANPEKQAAKRYLGKLTAQADLPPDRELIALIKEAMDLNARGVKLPPRASATPKEIAVPPWFEEKLKAHPKAKAVFESKSPSFRKEYLIWVTGAKTDATRDKRADEALGWIAEGKGRFWKYG
jgi:uncharacterized protein YdeI (YjbR/CyaY-like superfamily)